MKPLQSHLTILLAVLATATTMALCGCSALSQVPTKEGCQIVDAVHKACVYMRFLDPATGAVTEVRLTPEEAAEVGRAAVARQKEKNKGVTAP